MDRPRNEVPSSGSGGSGSGGHLNDDICLDLVHGLVPEDARAAIREHLVGCSACEKRLRAVAAEHECARACHRVVVTDLDIAVQATAAHRARPTASPRLPRRWHEAFTNTALRLSLSLAGAAAVVIAALLLWPHGGLPGSADLPVLPAHLEATQLRAAEDLPGASAILAGIEAYAAGDYRGACDRLAETPGQGPLEDVRTVYLGSALALRGRHAQAVAVLGSIDLWRLPDPWGAEGLWTLSVALRATGEVARADAILRDLAAEPGPVGDRARAALP
jgi:hypothetical protein